MRTALPESKHGKLLAVDIETNGTFADDPSNFIVGIGFADETGCWYIHLLGAGDDVRDYVKGFLASVRLTAFNVMFDGTFLMKWADKWLEWVGDSYGLFKQLSGEGYTGQRWDLETAQAEVLGWPTSNKADMADALKDAGLTKADMWRLDPEVLGRYCAIDADAHWQLWEELVAQCGRFPQMLDYHQRVYLREVELLAVQQLRGIYIDQDRLRSCHTNLLAQIHAAMESFLKHPEVAPHIEAHNQEVRAAWMAAEPTRLLKTGKVSKNWEKWAAREESWMAERGFNPNSKPQLIDLFYRKLGYSPKSFTDTGRPKIDRKVLPSLGEPGKLLNKYNLLVKRRGYVERVIERCKRDGLLHPQFNSVGTVTTRLGGSGKLNLQQMPKVADFLWAFKARPGHKLVQADAEALEPTILAEFSQDKTLLSVYGTPGRIDDIYLHVASKIEALGQEIRKFYDPNNPTLESIEIAKEACKADRSIAKKFHLMSTYKAGPLKIKEELELEGISLSLRQVKALHADYWKLFAGVLRFEEQLQDMWQANGGWIPSVFGTPICVAENLLKDIVNRFCQYSGHLVLQLWIMHTADVIGERRITAWPWLIDQHDEMFWECPENQAEDVAEAIAEGLRRTNEELGMGILIKGPAAIIDNMAMAKVPNYAKWAKERAG